MLATIITAVILVGVATTIHYEALCLLSDVLDRLERFARLRLLFIVLGCFIAHTLECWIYGYGIYLLDLYYLEGKGFSGAVVGGYLDHVYFATVAYTSLGLGDVYPTGPMRLMAGVTALNGLLLIAWSASFAYFAMQHLWPIPDARHLPRRRVIPPRKATIKPPRPRPTEGTPEPNSAQKPPPTNADHKV